MTALMRAFWAAVFRPSPTPAEPPLRLRSVRPRASRRPTQWTGPSAEELLARIVSRHDLQPITWWQFESVVAEMYRRLGYSEVVVVGSSGADGGVDIKMRRGSEVCVVQCRHLRPRERVKLESVRAFAFVAQKHRADRAIFVTTGLFSPPAQLTAAESPVPMSLVDGEACWNLVRECRGLAGSEPIPKSEGLICPRCGRRAVSRVNRGTGERFWGCSGYPRCRWTAQTAPTATGSVPSPI